MVPRRLIAALAVLCATPALAAALDVELGKALFERNWVSAPSSTAANDGLGPLYDAPSCAACHVVHPQADNTPLAAGAIIRLGNAEGAGDPVYGAQLQRRGVAGMAAEAVPAAHWTQMGTKRRVTLSLTDLAYGPLAKDTRLSLRRAPPLEGVGVLAQIPLSEILKRADPEDVDGDGISGRAAWLDGRHTKLGRFGWKAMEPDLAAQTSLAFARDIGLSTSPFPEASGDCTAAQIACRAAPQGAPKGEVEVPESLRNLIVAYLTALPAPKPLASPEGAGLFTAAGCAACHATLTDAKGRAVPAYSDLLLHDMGPGLADGIAEGAAQPSEWRTAPLWNVARSLKAGGLLHDGRARTVADAIEWHGGEADRARAHFAALTAADRAVLVRFVSGL